MKESQVKRDEEGQRGKICMRALKKKERGVLGPMFNPSFNKRGLL
jgi:hypothetical protein